MNLEDELNRLFQDDRIDIPVRPGAEPAVVAGARRRRQRRNAAAASGGALTLVALTAVSIALSGVGGGRTDTLPATNLPITTIPTSAQSLIPPPTGSATPSSRTSAPSSPTHTSTAAGSTQPNQSTTRSGDTPVSSQQRPASADPTIGPAGWGRLTLGMSEAAAVATDEFDMDEGVSGSPCHRYWLRNTNGAPVDISSTYGVARISARSGVTTPEGIGAGSTDAEVLAAYPNATTTNYVITAPVPGNANAVYIFNTSPSRTVSSLRLELATHNC